MRARDLMTPNPALICSSESVQRAADLMRARGVGMLPVVDDAVSRTLCGIITDRDIAVRCVAPNHSVQSQVGVHMTTMPLAAALADDDVAVVCDAMERNHIRRLPVIDDFGAVIGVISQVDLALRIRREDRLAVERLLARVSIPSATRTPRSAWWGA